MKIFENTISHAVFAIHVLLIFLLFFESQVSIPTILQPLGRMHPLVLHFPIGLLVLVGLFQFLRNEIDPQSFRKIHRFTLHITVFSTAIAALMGFFLSQEDGYASLMMTQHKWTGIAVSFLAYGLLLLEPYQSKIKWAFPATLVVSLLVLIVAGHLGASITHGSDFVWSPLMTKKPQITEQTPIFEASIQPILEDKCYSCHNNSKTKGDLNMTSVELLTRGGENGPIWKAGDAMNSHMVQRALLPLEDEEHMPPEGKEQLTPTEINVLVHWIDAGADTELTFADISEQDTLYQLTMEYVEETLETTFSEPQYEFSFVSNETLESLNNPFRSVSPVSSSSPALQAQIFVRQAYQENYLTDLQKVKDQIISLNLTNLPITDEDISTITQFVHLEKLILNGTDITGNTLSYLENCQKLTSLAVSNTQVGENLEKALTSLSSLEEVYVWNTQIPNSLLVEWEKQYPNIHFHRGYIPDESEILTLSPPLLENESRILAPDEKVVLRNSFPGAEIRYTMDGTEPDSIQSALYAEPLSISSFSTIKAKTFKAGWISSETESFTFFIDGYKPIEAELINEPNPSYMGKGASTLIDGKKGFASAFRSPDWVGFKDKPFIAMLDYGESPPEINNITISYALNIFQYLMPPQKVELWAGNTPEQMQKLSELTPEQPDDYQKNEVFGINIPLENSTYRYYKVVAASVQKLPAWHRGAGDKGWVFVDEIFAY